MTTRGEKVEQLLEMGFQKDRAELALTRANDDMEQAMNYLVDGMSASEPPELLEAEPNIIRAAEPTLVASAPRADFSTIPINSASSTYANPSVPSAPQAVPALSAAHFAQPRTDISPGHIPIAQPVAAGPGSWAADVWRGESPQDIGPSAGAPYAGRKPFISDTSAATSSREDQQLQEALALSLKEQTQQQVAIAPPAATSSSRVQGLSKEDEEMAKAIEQSLRSQTGGGDLSLCSVADAGDPRKLAKEAGTAVGLKNVGNTCYCNSLLQTYWAIGSFRDAVTRCPVPQAEAGDGAVSVARAAEIGAQSKQEAEAESKERESQAAVELVGELQRLFAFMALSERKMVDPSAVLRSLLDSSGKPVKVGNQEDVSEFNHLFLDRVQQGLCAAHKSHGGEGYQDVISTQFEGKMLQEVAAVSAGGQRHLLSASRDVKFKEIILNIDRGDIHLALEDYVEAVVDDYAQPEADSVDTASPGCIHKSMWIQELPPILTFHLNRVGYDKKLQAAVKVDTAFNFPATLYMDRYLEQHREEVPDMRQRVAALRKDTAQLQAQLDKLNQYQHKTGRPSAEHIVLPEDDWLAATVDMLKSDPAGEDVSGAVALLERRLQRVAGERLQLEKQLEARAAEAEAVYSCMRQHEYQLLAVLVHDGLAASGHYWAYIKGAAGAEPEAGSGGWHKYSDMSVTQVEEEEVFRVSQGGSLGGASQASAYCLFFHRTDVPTAPGAHAKSGGPKSVYTMPHLQREVEDDNRCLQDDIKAWERASSVHQVCAKLDQQVAALERAHASASAAGSSAHDDWSLEYFLLRLKEPALARHVMAVGLTQDTPALAQAYQDNQLRTELNVKSGGALEPEPTALHLLQVLQEAHRLWLVANEHYREAHRALAAGVHNAGARAHALAHLASACWVRDNNASKLVAAEPLFPPAGRELRALLFETLQDKLGLPLDTASPVVLGSPEKMDLLAQVAEAVLSAVRVLDAASIQDVSAQTAAIVDKMMQVTARGAKSCPASEVAMQRLEYVRGKAHSMSRGDLLSPSSGGPGSGHVLPELPLIPVPKTREEARAVAQRLQGSHDMAENPVGAQDLTDQAMQLHHRTRTPKGDDPMDLH